MLPRAKHRETSDTETRRDKGTLVYPGRATRSSLTFRGIKYYKTRNKTKVYFQLSLRVCIFRKSMNFYLWQNTKIGRVYTCIFIHRMLLCTINVCTWMRAISQVLVERDYSGSPLKVNTVFACPCDYLAMSRPSLCNCAIWPGIDVIIRSKRWA